jgi:ATP-binding cassette subfamily B protein
VRERLAAFRHVFPFLVLAWRAKPSYAAGIVVLRIADAFTPLAVLWVGKLIVDTVVANIRTAAPDWRRLVLLVSLELGVALVAGLVGRFATLLESLLGDVFSNDVSIRLMRHAATLDLGQFEDPEFFDGLRRARRQSTDRAALLTLVLNMAQQAVTLVLLLGSLVLFEWWLVLILVLAILPSFLGETTYAGITYSFMFQWTKERRALDYYQWVASEVEPAKEIKLFGLADYFIGKYAELSDDYQRENRRVATHRALTSAVLSSFSTVAYYGAVGLIVYRTVVGRLTLGEMTFLVGSFQRSRAMIGGILQSVARGYEQSLHLRDLFEFLGVKPAIASAPNARRVPAVFREGFVFEGVGFRYPDSERWAVRHLSFHIRRGERIALVGDNGAGKTTVVKLLTRLYEPTEGRILLDGVDLREYDLESLRGAVGVIFQNFFRFDLSARDNIAVGYIEAHGDHDRIVRSADKSLAAGVIAGLERGYDHILGRRFEGGADLSGGEWQKIALARAYMRDAQVLILDEPTAALDVRAEYEVFQRFSELTAGKMALLISHRFSTVRMADRILVLEKGAVRESGNHDVLMNLGGRYAELFAKQAAGYR